MSRNPQILNGNFSIRHRQHLLESLQSTTYDLLVIGGGITGAGIALDAASRGLKTALIEKNDFAFGTSSRSTKLIHGGLRYLKQLEFGLVKEVGSERAIVHRLAPHLVIPEKMLLPLSEKKGLGYWLTSIGLFIYDFLAGVRPEDQRRMLTRNQTLRKEPLLKRDDIKGGAIYAEYRTDDARLTIEIAKTAFRHGAILVNYVSAEDFTYADDTIRGVIAKDQLTGATFPIAAKAVVSAAGPWVDQLREINRSNTGKHLHLTKGVHIVVDRNRFPVKQSIYFDVDDGRMIFAIPRGRTTYIGTTDTTYTGDVDNVFATAEDAVYLVNAVNATFPRAGLSVNDIESSWAGLRPLIHEEGKSASQLSRKDEIFESRTGLISIAGGKLTGYRKMAERVVNLVFKKHFGDRPLPKCYTQKIKLEGASFNSDREVRRYASSIMRFMAKQNLPDNTAAYLVANYGKQTDLVLEHFMEIVDSDPDSRLLKSEFRFVVESEMCLSLLDFFIRRTGLVYFNIPRVMKYRDSLALYAAELMGWSADEAERQRSELQKYIENITRFKT